MSRRVRLVVQLLAACLPAVSLFSQAEQVALEPVDPVVARFVANEPLDVAPDIPLEPRKLSLRRLPAPKPANLADFIADEKTAIVLGKALFWDMQLGSDGVQACASCHFHAGADNRSRAQLSPSLLITDASGAAKPDRTLRNATMAHQLTVADYPFRKLANTEDRASGVLADSNDVAGSQGVRNAVYAGLESVNGVISEKNTAVPDAIFNYGGRNTRRVTPRNAPTVINAVYNVRNFWDGRAQNTFNGVNPWGLRDAKARVWRADNAASLVQVAVKIPDASLASQAVGPALSDFEMSGAGREFPDIGRRILTKRPLAGQKVHKDDSVLGSLSNPAGGLTTATYADLVKKAFRREWWQAMVSVPVAGAAGTSSSPNHAGESEQEEQERKRVSASNGLVKLDNDAAKNLPKTATGVTAPYSQIEANFSLFFGLAIQMYESTLVSDDAPIDRWAEGDVNALTPLQRGGLEIFTRKGRCDSCHTGATFTAAARAELPDQRIEILHLAPNDQQGMTAAYDAGYYNIGVRPIREDIGLGAKDPFGYPLAEARLLAYGLEKKAALTGYNEFYLPFPNETFDGDGFFKVPTLRNVELTAPYFHNGGTLTLEQVVEFYNRGGDFYEKGHNNAVRPLKLTIGEKEALVAFLRALTDERVRYDRAPFDHPQLFVPNGPAAVGAASADTLVELPAVGRAGGTPRQNFLQ